MGSKRKNQIVAITIGAILFSLIPTLAQAAPPTAPRDIVGTAGNGFAKISFKPPSPNATITNYKFTIDSGTTYTTISPGLGSSASDIWGTNYTTNYSTNAALINQTYSLWIFGLTPGTTYNINLIAVNADGDSPPSATVAVTPTSGVPSPPGFMSKLASLGTIPGAPNVRDNLMIKSRTDSVLTIDFTEPPNGGSPIDYYQYAISTSDTLTEGQVTWVDFATPSATLPLEIPIGGLSYTSSYYLYLRSHNANGFSAFSRQYTDFTGGGNAHSVGFTRPGLPSRPSAPVATRSGSNVIVSFTPGSDGGYPITDYLYSTDGTNYTSAGSGSSPITVPGAATGSVVTISIKAVNSIGTSPSARTVTTGPLTATRSVASKVLAVSAAATSFTPVTGSYGTAPYSYSVSPTLPTGLSMNASSGAITGTPTVSGAPDTYTVTITDAASATSLNTFSLEVASVLATTLAIASKTLTATTAATSFTPVTATGGTARAQDLEAFFLDGFGAAGGGFLTKEPVRSAHWSHS